MRVIQFSTPTCAPCRRNKEYIEKYLKPKEGSFEYVDITTPENKAKWKHIFDAVPMRGVPFYIIADNNNQLVEVLGNASVEAFKWITDQNRKQNDT